MYEIRSGTPGPGERYYELHASNEVYVCQCSLFQFGSCCQKTKTKLTGTSVSWPLYWLFIINTQTQSHKKHIKQKLLYVCFSLFIYLNNMFQGHIITRYSQEALSIGQNGCRGCILWPWQQIWGCVKVHFF